MRFLSGLAKDRPTVANSKDDDEDELIDFSQKRTVLFLLTSFR